MQQNITRGPLNGEGSTFAIVVSRWNDFLTSKLADGAVDGLTSHGVSEAAVDIFHVPGAFELPLAAQKLAETGKYDAIIALGVVIRGETPHFDYVASEAARGITNVGLKTGIPVMFGVITANTSEQAVSRSGVKDGNKGYEAAVSAIEMVSLFQGISGDAEEGKDEKALTHVV
ncbi:MAG: 6,7-dimethyl-8-ribityllumazine synthase [Blastocatellia bacterium]|nr:6,7-dimethyl-8-ribityllumazine synthase [Blastocatellia bacterium]